MPTVKEIMDLYEKNPAIRSTIDAALGLQPEQYMHVKIKLDGDEYNFANVTELTNLTNYEFATNTYRVNHVLQNKILQTELVGHVIAKTKMLGEVKK